MIEYLNHHPLVEKVNHPLLADHPDHDLYKKFFKMAEVLFYFEIKGGIKEAHEFIDHLEIFLFGKCCGCQKSCDPSGNNNPFSA